MPRMSAVTRTTMPLQRGPHRGRRCNDTTVVGSSELQATPSLHRWGSSQASGASVAGLLAQAELLYQCGVALGVLVLQVGEEALALVDELEQATPAVMVLGVGLEMRR